MNNDVIQVWGTFASGSSLLVMKEMIIYNQLYIEEQRSYKYGEEDKRDYDRLFAAV